MSHNIDCTPDTSGNIFRLVLSSVLILAGKFAETIEQANRIIHQTETIIDFCLKIFQIGAYSATIGMFAFTIYKFIKEKKNDK